MNERGRKLLLDVVAYLLEQVTPAEPIVIPAGNLDEFKDTRRLSYIEGLLRQKDLCLWYAPTSARFFLRTATPTGTRDRPEFITRNNESLRGLIDEMEKESK